MRRPVRHVIRLVGWVLAGAITLVLLAGVGIAGLLWMTQPPGGRTLALAGLTAPVDVTFDADGVPRIAAATEADAAAALGYVHARDRMFQMELMRRAASGRLSEIAGGATLRIDRTMRTLGNKVSARELVVSVGAPLMPATGPLPDSPAELRRLAAELGYPVMLKASWGGGGRGMRPIERENQLLQAASTARLVSATRSARARLSATQRLGPAKAVARVSGLP